MKKNLAITLITILAIASITLGTLYYTNNNEKNNQITTLNTEISKKESQIEALNSDIGTKEEQIQNLNTDITNKETKIETLNNDIENKKITIQKQSEDLSDKAALIETLNENVSEKAELIVALNADIESKTAQVEELNTIITDKDEQIEKLNTEVSDENNTITKLNKDISDKTSKINELNQDIELKGASIESLKTEITDKTAKIDELSINVADKEEKIEKLNAARAEQEKTISDLKVTISEQKKSLNYSKMTERELLAVVDKIKPPLESKGYSVLVRDFSKNNQERKTDTSVEDEFLSDLVKGLEDRWSISDKYDTSTMIDKQVIELYSACVMCELDHIGKYTDAVFSDKTLEEYAHAYITALQNQLIGITEYYGIDDAQYNELWNNAYFTRAQMLYRINRKYGLNVARSYKSILNEFLDAGLYADQYKSIEQSLHDQLSETIISVMRSNSMSIETRPFTLKNNTAYIIDSLSISMNLYNDKDEIVSKGMLLYENSISSGKEIKVPSEYISTQFDHFDFEYEFYVSGNYSGQRYREKHIGSVSPTEQFGWDGTVVTPGSTATSMSTVTPTHTPTATSTSTTASKPTGTPMPNKDKFTFRNGITFLDTIDTIETKEVLGIAEKTETTLKTVEGTISSIGNSYIIYSFSDDGKLFDVYMDFGVHIGKHEQAISAYNTVYEALVGKYGLPATIKNDAWYVIYGSAVKEYTKSESFLKSLGITPSLQDKSQWILRFDDINVKIDLIRYAPNGGSSSDVIMSYRFFTDEDEQIALGALNNQKQSNQNDL